MKKLEVIGLEGIGEVRLGCPIGEMIRDAYRREGLTVEPGDVLVVAQKIVSKAEGRVLRLSEVIPSARAVELSTKTDKDPKLLEVILGESRRVIKMARGVLIVETHHGFVCANAGVDLSNVGVDQVALLPEEPDRSAENIREEIRNLTGVAPAVAISDSFGRPWRLGTTEVALGVAGIKPLRDDRGKKDSYGYELKASVQAIGDELVCAASLVMGKRDRIPVALVRGLTADPGSGSGRDLQRPEEQDLFRGD
ncbi:MAG: coenzyme F420-0:L-glutamate ligase [Deltaproteobacteria bacterium]|nr:coenzyme F420-0:L-glutamate ligase [Deltaproteobacteria bacterium]